jgi:hypothetical protein
VLNPVILKKANSSMSTALMELLIPPQIEKLALKINFKKI